MLNFDKSNKTSRPFTNKFVFIVLICAILFIFLIYSHFPLECVRNLAIDENPLHFEYNQLKSAHNSEFRGDKLLQDRINIRVDAEIGYCGDEMMRYSLRIRRYSNLSTNFVMGHRFNCSFLWLLHKFKLSDKYIIEKSVPLKRPGEDGFFFVTAANYKYYAYLKTLLFNLKKTFKCQQKIIVYDMDGFSLNKTLREPLNAVCGLEIRMFNWSYLLPDVRERMNIFAWKFIIFAHSFAEFDTWIWLDTSIIFHEPMLFEPIFMAIEKGNVSELIIPGDNYHGMRFATNPRMYNFLPFAPDWYPLSADWEKKQWESNIFIVHKSEYSRKLLKWALLCALTRQCIEPFGTRVDLKCDESRLNDAGMCNRQDQSILTILTVNAEHDKLYNEGINFLPHADSKHPRIGLVGKKYEVLRYRRLNEADERNFVSTVNCCHK